MRLRQILCLAMILAAQQWCAAQDNGELTPVSAVESPPSAPAVVLPIEPTSSTNSRGLYLDGWRQLGPNLARDQKAIWLFPLSVAKGDHVKPTVALIGLTAALIGLDQYSASYFYHTRSFRGFNSALSGPNTALATELVPAALYAVGLARGDKYAQETFFLAGRAVLDSEILTAVMKDIDRREISNNGNFTETWFDKKGGSYFGGAGSFPSGHTIAAFAVATAYADRYPNPRWRRWVIFGLAGLVGFSRVSMNAHYVADVFAGAALGYAITHYQVLGLR